MMLAIRKPEPKLPKKRALNWDDAVALMLQKVSILFLLHAARYLLTFLYISFY